MSPTALQSVVDLWVAIGVPTLIKATALLVLFAGCALLLQRSTAASRHLAWSYAVLGLLALPAFQAALPSWQIETPLLAAEEVVEPVAADPNLFRVSARFEPAVTPIESAVVPLEFASTEPIATVESPAQERAESPWVVALSAVADRVSSLDASTWLLLAWELGALLVLGFFVFGRLRVRRLERRCEQIRSGDWIHRVQRTQAILGMNENIRVLRSSESVTPMTWGALRPVLLLPAAADEWSDEQWNGVLVHELHHIQRRDALTQGLAQAACVLYWFHPLVWVAAARMRRERERACDDRVLMAGSKASTYANHLLEMARSLRAESATRFATVAMARRSQLSDRLLAVLDPEVRRVSPKRWKNFVAAAVAIALLLPLAAIVPVAPQVDAAPPDSEARAKLKQFPRAVRGFVAPGPPSAPRVFAVPSPKSKSKSKASPWPVAPTVSYVSPTPPLASTAPQLFSMSGGGHDIWSHGSGSFSLSDSDGRITMSYSDGRERIWMEIDGDIELNDTDSDVVSLSPGGYFEVGEGKGRRARRVEIEAADDGELTRVYFEGRREAEWTDETQEWFAGILQDAVRNLGIGADERVARIYENSGLEGVMDEIDEIRSDHVRKQYYQAFLELDGPTDEERRDVLGSVARDLDSDYELAQLLVASMDDFLGDDEMRELFFEVLRKVDSDYERSRVLQSAFDRHHFSPEETVAVLGATRGIHSDYEQGQVLKRIDLDHLQHHPVRDAFFGAVDRLGSDYERSQILQALLDDADNDPELAGRILRASLEIDSDYERAQVLLQTADSALQHSELVDLYFDAVDEIHSDYERGRVISVLMDEADLNKDQQIRLIELIDDIGSDYERTNLLIDLAQDEFADEEVEDAIREAIDRIGSDHEYGRAMRALRNNKRRAGQGR